MSIKSSASQMARFMPLNKYLRLIKGLQVKINNLKEKEKENALNEVRLLASISC